MAWNSGLLRECLILVSSRRVQVSTMSTQGRSSLIGRKSIAWFGVCMEAIFSRGGETGDVHFYCMESCSSCAHLVSSWIEVLLLVFLL